MPKYIRNVKSIFFNKVFHTKKKVGDVCDRERRWSLKKNKDNMKIDFIIFVPLLRKFL